MADGGLLSLSWNNHKATFCHILSNLRERERYTDVTLACDGKFYPVHKLVLSTCSEYFESMFEHTPCKHPIVVLKDLKCDEVESLLSYMYAGVVNVAQNDLARLIKAAELLKVKGLAVPDEPPPPQNHSQNHSTYPQSKRRRRDSGGKGEGQQEGNASRSPPTSPPNSPYHPPDYPSEEHRTERSIDRIEEGAAEGGEGSDHHHQGLPTSGPPSPLQVVLEETLVKEEMVDPPSDDKDDLMSSGLDYGSMSDNPGGGGSNDPTPSTSSHDHKMIGLKYDQQQQQQQQQAVAAALAAPQPHHLSDSVMEALAGPSGMQGWLSGGGDLGAAFPGVEGFDARHLTSQGHPLMQLMFTADECKTEPQSDMEEEEEDTKEHIRQYITHARHTDQTHTDEDETHAPTHAENNKRTHTNTKCKTEDKNSVKTQKSTDTDKLHGTTQPHQCPVCEYGTGDYKEFRAHIDAHGSHNAHICPYCMCVFNHRRDLKTHTCPHTKNKPYACPHCSFRCSRNSYLKIHLRLHTGEKPNECPVCPYQSFIPQHFKRHLKTHEK